MKTREQLLAAVKSLSDILEDHPIANEQMIEEIRAGKFDMAKTIGGDEATISQAVAIIREALEE